MQGEHPLPAPVIEKFAETGGALQTMQKGCVFDLALVYDTSPTTDYSVECGENHALHGHVLAAKSSKAIHVRIYCRGCTYAVLVL